MVNKIEKLEKKVAVLREKQVLRDEKIAAKKEALELKKQAKILKRENSNSPLYVKSAICGVIASIGTYLVYLNGVT